MAFSDRLRRIVSNRYTPFFLPIVGSLIYIGLSILLIPSNVSGTGTGSDRVDGADDASGTASAGSAHGAPGSPAARRARLSGRSGTNAETPGAMPKAGGPQGLIPMQTPPAPVPASPDGAE